MKTLRRYLVENTYYFITSVTFDRKPILLHHIPLFWKSWEAVSPMAWVILPDHFHILIDVGNGNISYIMHNFKRIYTWNYNKQIKKGKVWQNRFWDHVIKDQDDYNNHLDYIHFNPMKHGIIDDPFEYPHSSLKLFEAVGFYQRDKVFKIEENEDNCFRE